MVVPLELDPGRYDRRSPLYQPSEREQRAIHEAKQRAEYELEQARARAQKQSPNHYKERVAWAAERWWRRRKEIEGK